jgi:hypothetical protein
MSKKKLISGILVLLICILVIVAIVAVLPQSRRTKTTGCVIKGTITDIEDNVFTVVPDTSYLDNMGPSNIIYADYLLFCPSSETKVYGRYGMTEVDISELYVGDYVQVKFTVPIDVKSDGETVGEYDGQPITMEEIKYQIKQ